VVKRKDYKGLTSQTLRNVTKEMAKPRLVASAKVKPPK
jgi:hypothetical protein